MLIGFEAHRNDPSLGEHEYPIVDERSHPRTFRTEDILHKVLPDRLRPRCLCRGQRQPALRLYLHVARGNANAAQPTVLKDASKLLSRERTRVVGIAEAL